MQAKLVRSLYPDNFENYLNKTLAELGDNVINVQYQVARDAFNHDCDGVNLDYSALILYKQKTV